MARILAAFPSALIAAEGGMSANAFYRQLQSEGMGARRSETLALFRIAKSIVARSPNEIFRDIAQAPTNEDLQVWPTKKATGIQQNVTLVYRDRTTGTLSRTFYRTTSETGIPREQAMAQAIDAYQGSADEYNQDLIGAVHTSSYRLIPFSGV